MITWGISDTFGGMTGAFLHRSRAFIRLGGVNVDVLTFDARPDYPAVERQLRAGGKLIDGMRLVNLWDWLRDHPAPEKFARAEASVSPRLRAVFEPLEVTEGYFAGRRDGVRMSLTRYADDGVTELQVDHYRADGTLAVSDRRDTRQRGQRGGRSIVLCDRDGQPVKAWDGAWALYRWWLDRMRDQQPTTMIVDSKTSARFMVGYRRKNTLILHVVHASHLQGSNGRVVRGSRAAVFESPESFDSLVFLTERQRTEALALLGDRAQTAVIPNGRVVPRASAAPPARDVHAGIMLSALEKRKRVDHSVRAVASVRSAGTLVTLDIFGDGPEQSRVEAAVAKANGGITLRGYDPDASSHLSESSFLLLSSRSEGFPLVLVEAMAAGCLPISYDIAYGPADIIQDGVNGFLVPPGDVAALAAAIERLVGLPAAQVEAMRRNAIRTAAAYSDEAITKRWAREFDRAAKRRGFLPAAPVDALAFRLRRGIARRWRNWRGSR
ncbi:poly(glycerol-phosphate) alpha-glucosyltransferase [Okibacterium sp. HSC-33S16]|nr:poly(glycerol-phosphate) alpha-glucosyltransferase [Okibacterium sp. HSC-33S16]